MKKLQSIDDLKPAKYNPRKISERAAKGLGKSLDKYGDLSGVVWNSKTGNLVAGHQRVEQLRKAGATFAGGVIVAPDGESFPVRVVSWSVAKEKAANVTANNQALAGEFTDDLGLVLDEIKLDLPEIEFEELRLGEAVSPFKKRRWERRRPVASGGWDASTFFDMPESLKPQWDKASHIAVLFSGGRDSTAVAIWAAKHAKGKKLQLFFCDTGVEFPGLTAHNKDIADSLGGELIIIRPATDWWVWLRERGKWPSMIWHECIDVFIHKPFAKYIKKRLSCDQVIVLTGSRAVESADTSKKTERSEIPALKGCPHFAPCFNASKDVIIDIINKNGLPEWEGYARGFARTACWCCPCQQGTQAAALAENYPGLADEIRRWEKRLGPIQPDGGTPVSFDDVVARGQRKKQRAKRQ